MAGVETGATEHARLLIRAARREEALTGLAAATANDRRDEHLITGPEVLDLVPDRDDLADALMPHRAADTLFVHGAVVAVEIGAADGASRRAHECTIGARELRIRNLFDVMRL